MADRRPHLRKWASRLLVVITALLLPAAVAQAAGGKTLTATLTGAAEVPGPGDPDGSGEATVRLNSGRARSATSSVSLIAAAFAAHIHVGTVTEAGPVVVSLVPPSPTEGSSSGCTSVDPA
jgi:CHRD domain